MDKSQITGGVRIFSIQKFKIRHCSSLKPSVYTTLTYPALAELSWLLKYKLNPSCSLQPFQTVSKCPSSRLDGKAMCNITSGVMATSRGGCWSLAANLNPCRSIHMRQRRKRRFSPV